MNYFIKYCFFFLLFFQEQLVAQTASSKINITGCWQTYRNEEFMQFNIQQRGDVLCGYSYDYELYDRRSFCKANFEGKYDERMKMWYFTGNSFIENSGTHVLMRVILWHNENESSNVLHGKVYLQSNGSMFSSRGDNIVIKKMSNTPARTKGQKNCFNIKPKTPVAPSEQKPDKITPPKITQEKPAKEKTITKTPKKEIIKNDEIKQDEKKDVATIQPHIPTKTDKQLELKMTSRKQVEQSRVMINVRQLNLKLYDNGTVDGDTVSVFYNGRLLLSHQGLSEKAIELNIPLDESTNIHEITMYAENLGTIVPNTALVVVTAGNKRYELRSKASLEENAVLVFEYKDD